MKKIPALLVIVTIILTLSVGAYAHYEKNYGYHGAGRMMDDPENDNTMPAQQGGRHGRHGGMMRHGSRGAMMGRSGNSGYTCPFMSAQNQGAETVAEIITEEKAKAVAEEYIQTYLSGYTVETVEKDGRRPLYVVTVKGANDVEQQILIHGFSGQVMHVFPKTAE